MKKLFDKKDPNLHIKTMSLTKKDRTEASKLGI